MTSSIFDPSHASAVPSTACLYLLHSAVDAGKVKLGVTDHLATRLDSLRLSFGAFDLSRSVLVAAQTRRAAYDLENALKTVFAAPAWRVPYGPQVPGSEGAQNCNGHSEWYAAHATEPMVVFVAEVIKRDEASGASRYRIERGAKAFGAWSRRARSARAGVRLSESERAADAVARLTESAENFERVQAWMEGRQDRLVDVRPSLPSREGPLGRTYTLRLPTVTNGSTTDEATRAEWEDLACSCLVTFRHDAGCGTVSYFGCVSTHEASPSVYSVDLVIPDAFERLAATVPSLGVLLGRIRGWLCPA